MTTRTRVWVDGDPTVAEVIAAALRCAGLPTIDVEFAPRRRDVTPFPVAPGSWAALADVAPALAYADWRHEMLSLDVTADRDPLSAPGRRGSGVSALCRVV